MILVHKISIHLYYYYFYVVDVESFDLVVMTNPQAMTNKPNQNHQLWKFQSSVIDDAFRFL